MLCLLLALLQPPPVVDPPPVVAGKSWVPPKKKDVPANGYAACYAAVEGGARCTLAVGVEDAADYRTDALPGFTPGVYDCWLQGETPKMERRVPAAQPLIPRLFNPPIVPVLSGGT